MAHTVLTSVAVATVAVLASVAVARGESCAGFVKWTPPALAQLDSAGFSGLDHALSGRVWSHAGLTDPATVTPLSLCNRSDYDLLGQAVGDSLRVGGMALLGEVHDNRWHHALRASLIDALGAAGSRHGPAVELTPALVFEHIRADHQPALKQLRVSTRPATTLDLFRLLEWDRSGWPDKALFEPLFAAALDAKFAVLPGDPPRGKVRDVARNGLDVVAADDRARLKLEEPLPPILGAALADELRGSHCGMLPETAIPGMAVAQRYRDAHLADAVLKASAAHRSVVLLAGNGHVRNDRGVPWHIRQRDPDKKIVSVMLIEVEDGKTDPKAYAPRDPGGLPAVDYIVFTPRAERKDPCAEMRSTFGKR
jgi:uncharacterized iron-regulated protein